MRDVLCGDVLGDRYEIGALLGSGGTADVYRARDRRTGTAVAVKVHADRVGPHGLEHEIAVLEKLDHAAVVALLDAGTAAGRPYAVLELVEGCTLGEVLRRGPLRPGDVVALGAQLAEALAHVHARGVVHRDLKPANVLLDRHRRPRLADFGVARLLDGAGTTAHGDLIGTAAYMAPEQVRGEPVRAPADVYALGLVLLEAVNGRREYEGGVIESAVARLHRDPRVPRHVPDPLAEVLVEMTAPHPAWRPGAAGAARALRRVAAAPDGGSRAA